MNIYLGSDSNCAGAGYHAKWAFFGEEQALEMIEIGKRPVIFEVGGFPTTNGTKGAHAVIAYPR